MLKETNVSEIQKAVMIIHKMSDDEKIQEAARLREKALHDETTVLGRVKREEIAEGRAEERAKLETNLREIRAC